MTLMRLTSSGASAAARLQHLAQDAVDAEAHDEPALLGLDVDVGGVLLIASSSSALISRTTGASSLWSSRSSTIAALSARAARSSSSAAALEAFEAVSR